MTPEEWAAAATPGLSYGFKWNEQGDRLQQVPIPGRQQQSAQDQATALGGDRRRRQTRRDQPQVSTPTAPTNPQPTPTPQLTQPQVATSPVTGGPAQIPGWRLPYTAW